MTLPSKRHYTASGIISIQYFEKFKNELKTKKEYIEFDGQLVSWVFKNCQFITLYEGVFLISFLSDFYIKKLFDKYVSLYNIQKQVWGLSQEFTFIDPNEQDSPHYVKIAAELEELRYRENILQHAQLIPGS